MNWDQIETKWAEMARRIQVEWPFRPIFALDNATTDKRPETLADGRSGTTAPMENPEADHWGFSEQIQKVESSSRDHLVVADTVAGRKRA